MAKKKSPAPRKRASASAGKAPPKAPRGKPATGLDEARPAPPAPTQPVNTAASAGAESAADRLPEMPPADFAFVFQREGGNRGVAPPGLSLEIVGNGADEVFARMSGGQPAATAAGPTGGWSIQVPDAFEAAASGKAVMVSVCARAANGGPNAEFSCAYSTNEVGNSGWKNFRAGPGWQVFTLCYNVNPMVKGRGDFIGILPAPAGLPGVDIGFVAAKVTERPT